jgi:signal transduction histidine kinase
MDEGASTVISAERQTILLVVDDELVCAAARRELETRRPDVRVSAVNSVEAALRHVKLTAPNVILLADGLREPELNGETLQLEKIVKALGMFAPVVVMGASPREMGLNALIAADAADYVPWAEGCMTVALGLLERRLDRARRIADSSASLLEGWSKDFAEVLRHELNNPLTGILGNAELLLAEINRKKDGRLPFGGLERVETIAALAMRMRETVRQLSHQWEVRGDPAA